MDERRITGGDKLVKKWFLNRVALLCFRLIVGALFIYAGFTKIAGPQAFADSIATFRILPPQAINLLALGLPLFETIIGGMLIIGFKVRPAAFSVLVLTIIFAMAISQALARGLNIDCGCFGSGSPSVFKAWASLGRDILLMAMAGAIYSSRFRTSVGEEHSG